MIDKEKSINIENLNDIILSDTFCYNFISNSQQETKKLAKQIAKQLFDTDIIVLNGELGSGKTVFMSGLANYFNIEDQVSSPTFTIVNEYLTKNKKNIYHFDVYRLKNEIDFIEQIGTDYFTNGICIIEWGEIIKDILPSTTIFIDIIKDYNNENYRQIKIWRKL